MGSRIRKIQNATGWDRTAVVDADKGRSVIAKVRHTQPRPEWEGAVGAGEIDHVELLTIRRRTALKLLAIPRSLADLIPVMLLDRVGRHWRLFFGGSGNDTRRHAEGSGQEAGMKRPTHPLRPNPSPGTS